MKENKKIEETISDRKLKVFQGFAQMMDAVWGNDSGTKGLEKFLEQNNSVLENKEGGGNDQSRANTEQSTNAACAGKNLKM